jgi:transcriptional repressor NrdR
MRCPACGHLEDRVVDSREAQDGQATRRRRECLTCGRRYTTYERVEEALPQVAKKDGRREPFDRRKIVEGLQRACQKRPVSREQIDALVAGVERAVQETGEREVPSSVVGEAVVERLRELDEVAYVRFASVYREFRDVREFMSEVAELSARSAPAPGGGSPPAGAEARERAARAAARVTGRRTP